MSHAYRVPIHGGRAPRRCPGRDLRTNESWVATNRDRPRSAIITATSDRAKRAGVPVTPVHLTRKACASLLVAVDVHPRVAYGYSGTARSR